MISPHAASRQDRHGHLHCADGGVRHELGGVPCVFGGGVGLGQGAPSESGAVQPTGKSGLSKGTVAIINCTHNPWNQRVQALLWACLGMT